ncbi:TPR domain-containing protein [Drepanopeziza brunnea f. sp. 'multigermtubi' MB_m1]|uniref:TPR domain-containing protein n=1 Tax=Marssonina brunnea f. sp. multigermtubi (strain MB_m1) TaxID=1072389 RepID=K1X9K5_MARBU|nr:TPR domain-containing protein [Drepanopeziza brunnea f. sp. 'multigermtubi' MB_m1]EKD21652.1 TPR domain-containing protein [Drepanopeziza brunnea f. sp. 'multigermtubi' MB_m1]
MSQIPFSIGDQSLDSLLFNLDPLKQIPELSEISTAYLDGNYQAVLRHGTSQTLYAILVDTLGSSRSQQDAALQNAGFEGDVGAVRVLIAGLAAFNAFLQANVTGPPLELGDVFPGASPRGGDGGDGGGGGCGDGGREEVRDKCLRSLDVDGVSVYQYMPHVELLCLARLVFTVFFPRIVGAGFRDSKWMRVRINAYHQRLLSGVAGRRLSESTVLQDAIEGDLKELEREVLGASSTFSTEAKVQFLLEKAQIYIQQGLDIKARENVKMAKTVSGFDYALSGALGKRTKFQQNDLSQLVVFAKSSDAEDASTNGLVEGLMGSSISNGDTAKPESLQLNDDTLLETIEFTTDKVDASNFPPRLAGLSPNAQPQLKPLDQITLLTEATIKDAFLPLDKLNSEEILPYALRVLADKPTNWQIYTQALLVRSRIESHRSRTQERSILQLQVIVDQIIADTQEEPCSSPDGVPEIRVSQFLPRAKASESAPIAERLKYIYQLNTPTRWELETELAYAWSSVGSFVSALEIFKRLQLWAETALCYHTVGQEDKARQIVRRQLYFSSKGPEMDRYHVDAAELVTENWEGEMRPTPAHAPRLWCILGDLENDPACWTRAWEISKRRYARAQRSLGEYYVKSGDLAKAREAYMHATVVNRQNNDSWARLGDLDLRSGNWDGAIVAFQQSIMIDDTDAKTYSNLGSALVSKHQELVTMAKAAATDDEDDGAISSSSSSSPAQSEKKKKKKKKRKQQEDPKAILTQALSAYKRAAALAHTNWQIWDNVITIAGRISPRPAFGDLLLGLRNLIQLRAPAIGERAIDVPVLRLLVAEVTATEREDEDKDNTNGGGKYIPPRGSLARALIAFVEEVVVPLVTARADIWVLVERLALYQRDYEQALRCAEKAWRLVVNGSSSRSSSSSIGGSGSIGDGSAGGEWLVAEEAWREVVSVTDHLVSAYENYGPMERVSGGGGGDGDGGAMVLVPVEAAWKAKARSAVRGVMSKARDAWEGSDAWEVLEARLEELKK